MEETDEWSRKADTVWRAAGGWEKRGSAEDRADLIRLGRVRAYFTARMGDALGVASKIKSPVLVDPLLEFYEAGLNDRQSQWPRYLFLFVEERDDIIPRLRKIAADPKTDPQVKFQIEREFGVYAKQRAQAEDAEAERVAGAKPKAPPVPPSPPR